MPAAPPDYRVVYSGQVKEKLKGLLRQAEQAGKLRRFAAALVEMDARLRKAPSQLGELIGNLPWAGMPVHVGFVRPLRVDFAIHEAERTVFVRRVEAVTSLD